MHRRILVAMTLTLVGLAAACGGTDAGPAVAAGGSGGSGDVVRLDPSVLSGQARTVGGDTFDLGTLADRDLVVWFWAPW